MAARQREIRLPARQKPAIFAKKPLFVYRHFSGSVCTAASDGRSAASRIFSPRYSAVQIAHIVAYKGLLFLLSYPPPLVARSERGFKAEAEIWFRRRQKRFQLCLVQNSPRALINENPAQSDMEGRGGVSGALRGLGLM